MAAKDERLVAITPAMREGSGMVEFEKRFPKRFYDVGIAEQHAVTFAAGLACEGLKPVVAIYSTFLQRAYDQLIHDVAIQKLPVVFALDRGGLVGADGATHAGSFDIAYLRCIPNVSVLTPADENECRQALYTAFLQDHPVAVRYPRGSGAGVAQQAEMTAIPFGIGEIRRESTRTAAQPGKRIAILAFGTLLYPALAAAERLDATVANMRFAKPLDVALVTDLARRHDAIVTVEEGTIHGWRGQRGARGAGRSAHRDPGAHARPARHFRRARRSGQAAGAVRARRRRHRAVDPAPLRRDAGAAAHRRRPVGRPQPSHR